MAKARRIKKQRKLSESKTDQAIHSFSQSKKDADILIVTIPGVGSVGITSNVKDIKRYCD